MHFAGLDSMTREEAYNIVEQDLRFRIRPNAPHIITITLGTNLNNSPFLAVYDYIYKQGTMYAQNTSSLMSAVDNLFPCPALYLQQDTDQRQLSFEF